MILWGAVTFHLVMLVRKALRITGAGLCEEMMAFPTYSYGLQKGCQEGRLHSHLLIQFYFQM